MGKFIQEISEDSRDKFTPCCTELPRLSIGYDTSDSVSRKVLEVDATCTGCGFVMSRRLRCVSGYVRKDVQQVVDALAGDWNHRIAALGKR